MNHIYAQLHGYQFYLENPCPETMVGVTEELWCVEEHITSVLRLLTHG